MSIEPHLSSCPTTYLPPSPEAEKSFRELLTPMSLGQLQPLLSPLVEITKKENFNSRLISINLDLKKAESISRVFFNVVKEKGLIQEMEKDTEWQTWRDNVSWIESQLHAARQEESFGVIFPIVWH